MHPNLETKLALYKNNITNNLNNFVNKLPLKKICDEQESLQNQMSEQITTEQMIDLGKKLSQNQKKYTLALEIDKLLHSLDSNLESLQTADQEFKDMIFLELDEQIANINYKTIDLLEYLTPVDPRDQKDVLLEIKAGAGGDESALFASELLKAYQNASANLGFVLTITSLSANDIGGYRDVTAEIKGEGAYGYFKYEGGVHRVQRVPETEKQGRVHTSTIAVIISPLLEENTTEFKLDMQEVEVIATTSQGAGGQSVNTTYSAIKVKHFPTGIIAQCQDERNQQQNRIKALQVLTSRVYNHYQEIKLAEESKDRKDQVGTMDRSEKIRTYNFPQDRLTDHRYNHNWNQLPTIMTGGIGKVISDIKKMEAENFLNSL
jgi:peptide chain release factor 1